MCLFEPNRDETRDKSKMTCSVTHSQVTGYPPGNNKLKSHCLSARWLKTSVWLNLRGWSKNN